MVLICKHNHVLLTLPKAKCKYTGNASRKQSMLQKSTVGSLLFLSWLQVYGDLQLDSITGNFKNGIKKKLFDRLVQTK